MPPYKEFFQGKRVTLMGLGLLGRGLGDARFLLEQGAKLTITDMKSAAALTTSVEALAEYKNISWALGVHREEDFTHTDMVIKAAGVPINSPYIAAARTAGVPVYMSTALFAKFAREAEATLVGVTGTRGKSTTAQLIYHALKSAGKRTHLGGNIRGLSTLAMLPQVQKGDIAVFELDSWQLQGFGDLKLSPEIAIFTNLMPDHLNYYANEEEYFADKANIFNFQKLGDRLIVGAQVLERVLAAKPPVEPVAPKKIPASWHLRLVGEHNRVNASLAVEALRALGLQESEIRLGVESFEGVEGRLQKIAECNGAEIYNDNNATTPEATIAALRSFAGKRIILITGGSEKGLPFEGLLEELAKHEHALVLLAGTGTERFKKLLKENYKEAASMQEAVEAALAEAKGGNVVLMSPAAASFGMFKNEYDRNDQFVAAVKIHAHS